MFCSCFLTSLTKLSLVFHNSYLVIDFDLACGIEMFPINAESV